MTNGEKLEQVFPNGICPFNKNWLDYEYKEPTTKNDHHKQNIQAYAHDFGVSEEQAEKELRVTTKNDLEVDCNNCKNNFHRGDGTSYCTTGDGMCHYECEEPTTENDLGVDCVSREQALEPYKILENTDTLSVYIIRQNLAELPSMGRYDPYTDKFIKE